MIIWEASLIVLAGQAAGLICGFILSTLLIFVVNRQSFGWTFLYRVDWSSLLTALPLISAAALLAALPAVRLALSTSPATLLRGGTR
jgi:putative ABC transport system permease protein